MARFNIAGRDVERREPDSQAEERARNDAEAAARARHRRIEVAAYYRAEHRGFGIGREMDDWLAAEKDIDDGGPRPPATRAAARAGAPNGDTAVDEAGKTGRVPGDSEAPAGSDADRAARPRTREPR